MCWVPAGFLRVLSALVLQHRAVLTCISVTLDRPALGGCNSLVTREQLPQHILEEWSQLLQPLLLSPGCYLRSEQLLPSNGGRGRDLPSGRGHEMELVAYSEAGQGQGREPESRGPQVQGFTWMFQLGAGQAVFCLHFEIFLSAVQK